VKMGKSFDVVKTHTGKNSITKKGKEFFGQKVKNREHNSISFCVCVVVKRGGRRRGMRLLFAMLHLILLFTFGV